MAELERLGVEDEGMERGFAEPVGDPPAAIKRKRAESAMHALAIGRCLALLTVMAPLHLDAGSGRHPALCGDVQTDRG